jgi:hypothetical protein
VNNHNLSPKKEKEKENEPKASKQGEDEAGTFCHLFSRQHFHSVSRRRRRCGGAREGRKGFRGEVKVKVDFSHTLSFSFSRFSFESKAKAVG